MIERIMETKLGDICIMLGEWYTATAQLLLAAVVFGYIALKVFG